MKKYANILIGADVEVFLQNKETKEIISAEGYIKGTKDEPFCFDEANPFFATSLDNVLAEFSIPPARTVQEFKAFIEKSLGYINNNIPKDFCTVALPSARLNGKYLRTKQAKLFGCEPDYNAYHGHENLRPDAKDKNLRSAGGHIHIGYDDPAQFNQWNYLGYPEHTDLIKALDLFIGVPSVIMEPDNKRKELYGKAGAFRPKSYGVEYRTVSNFYLGKPELIDWVFNAAQEAIVWLNANNEIDNVLAEAIQSTINNNDKEQAQQLINHFNLKAA